MLLVLGKDIFASHFFRGLHFFARNPAIAALSNCGGPFEMASKPDLSLILDAEKSGCNDLVNGSYRKQINQVLFLSLVTSFFHLFCDFFVCS